MFKTLIYGGQEYKNFEIDELGNVINKKTDHIYKLSKNKNGYAVVYLPAGARGRIKAIRVHKAVAETFIPNPTNLPVVNHIDENRFNPCIWNLEWVDYAGNTEAHWKKEKEKGDFFNNRKLTYEEAEQLRKDSKTMGYQKLGKKYGISKVSARNIVIGKCYANGF